MATYSLNPLQQNHLSSITLCKYSSTLITLNLHSFSHHLTTSTLTNNTLLKNFSAVFLVRANASRAHKHATKAIDPTTHREMESGFYSLRSMDERVVKKSKFGSVVVDEKTEERCRRDSHMRKTIASRNREMGSGLCALRVLDKRASRKSEETQVSSVVDDKTLKKSKKAKESKVVDAKMEKESKKNKVNSGELPIRIGLDMCSKRGDVMGAISIYDTALRDGIKLGQYHYNVILYLCSSAAVGVVRPAKSGNSNRSLDKADLTNDFSSSHLVSFSKNGDMGNGKFGSSKLKSLVSDGVLVELGKNHGRGRDKMESDSLFSRRVLLGMGENGADNTTNFDKMEPDSIGLLADLGENNADSRLSSNKMGLNSNGLLADLHKHDGKGSFKKTVQNSRFSIEGVENGLHNERTESIFQLSEGFSVGNGKADYENETEGRSERDDDGIRVSDDVKKYALARGFEIYEMMCSENIPLSEAALTSIARMAMSMGNGDLAFDMVKQMRALGINPRLRSYGPALLTFCNSRDIEKAFEIEKHMLESGVYPEEPELQALLRLSIGLGRGEKVYYLLHKLRTSVRKVSSSTAELIEKWFKSSAALRVGKRKWDERLIVQAIGNGGGGWHGMGWLGRGKWTVSRTSVGADGVCGGCGEKLTTIDIDPVETENFAQSVASIAGKRERNSSFQTFQKWLDYYGPFEAVVDAANVGLFSQRRFLVSKVNAVVNGIRQKLPSKKWPLIIVHNRRINGGRMDEPVNRTLIEKWKNADALYATPSGSNDDWYWLYAAIKCKCFIVTNDEMRDHIFQVLGNDFFPKWKERHQVHFSFGKSSPEFHMPPPCSIVIQESEKGHWHIPIAPDQESMREITWLCATRDPSHTQRQELFSKSKGWAENASSGHKTSNQKEELSLTVNGDGEKFHSNTQKFRRKIYKNPRNTPSTTDILRHHTIISEIEAAEKLSGSIVDFQI